MSRERSVSKLILDELTKISTKDDVHAIAEDIMFFEMENFRMKNPRYKNHIEKIISFYSKKRT